MDITLLIVIVGTIVCGLVILYLNGWKFGFLQLSVLLVFVAVYFLTIKFFGVEGKKYLAGVFLLLAAWMFYYRRKKRP